MSYSGKSKTAADEDWVGELLVNVATLTSIGMFRFALRWPDIASLLTVFAVTGVLRLALDVRADRGVRGGRMGVAAGLAGLVRAADRQAGRRLSAHVSGVSAAVDTLKPSWGRLGRVRDLQRRRESCRFARSVGRDRRRGKGQKWRRTGPDCSQARPLRQHRGQAAANKPAFLGTVCGNCRSHGGPSRIGISRRLQTHSELRGAALRTFAILHICAALHP